MKLFSSIILNLLLVISFAQVGINTDDPKAILDVTSTTDGVLLPRLTSHQINQITNPEEGLLLYNLTENCLQIYDGIAWNCLEIRRESVPAEPIDTTAPRGERVSSNISQELNELSGLHHIKDGYFLAHNDGENVLYKTKDTPPFSIDKKFNLGIAISDWEAVTVSDDFVFIGDFGNNYAISNRTKIHYFSTDELRKEGTTVNIQNVNSFSFVYPEQTLFNLNLNETDYDTEAFVYIDGALHLFTKQWTTKGTAHYTIPFTEGMTGNVSAILKEDYQINFLVTDAAYIKSSSGIHHLFLSGYDNGTPFKVYLQQFTTLNTDQFFSNESIQPRIEIGSLFEYGQVEGLAVKSYTNTQKELCFGAEGNFIIPQKISCIKFN